MRLTIVILLGLFFSGCGAKNQNKDVPKTVAVILDANTNYVQKFGIDLAEKHPDLMFDYENNNSISDERQEKFCSDLDAIVSVEGNKMVPTVLKLQDRRISYCEIAGKGTLIANCARNVKLKGKVLSYTSQKKMDISVKVQREGDMIFFNDTTINGQPAVWPSGTDVLVEMLDSRFRALQYAVYACLNKLN